MSSEQLGQGHDIERGFDDSILDTELGMLDIEALQATFNRLGGAALTDMVETDSTDS